jgi:hypothetical protein
MKFDKNRKMMTGFLICVASVIGIPILGYGSSAMLFLVGFVLFLTGRLRG